MVNSDQLTKAATKKKCKK